jgi:FlaA1/EpsC-like NDP-sugar epimerase
MLSDERTNNTKLFYFALFIAVNGFSCVFILFILDYAHNFLNGIIIPSCLLWDQNHRIKADKTEWCTAQVLIVMAELVNLLWLLCRFNRRNIQIWLVQESMWIARSVTWLIVSVVAIVTLFERGGFII